MPDADLLPPPLHVTAWDFTVVVPDTVVLLDAAEAVIDPTLGDIVLVPEEAFSIVASLVAPESYS